MKDDNRETFLQIVQFFTIKIFCNRKIKIQLPWLPGSKLNYASMNEYVTLSIYPLIDISLLQEA